MTISQSAHAFDVLQITFTSSDTVGKAWYFLLLDYSRSGVYNKSYNSKGGLVFYDGRVALPWML